jgi:transposase
MRLSRCCCGCDEQIQRLEKRVATQDERIAQLERRIERSSRNSSQPPSSDPPGGPAKRGKDRSGRTQGAQPGHEGKGRPLLPAWAIDEVVEHWPIAIAAAGTSSLRPSVSVGQPTRHQVEELPVMAVTVTEHHCQRMRCPGGAATVTAVLPSAVAASAFGPRLQAAIVPLSVRTVSRVATSSSCVSRSSRHGSRPGRSKGSAPRLATRWPSPTPICLTTSGAPRR